ncbi:MAG: hypothetical protein EOO56_26310 [Hymenobacter sp.]|nr:MAG: hypothetical protein EOO56_26310 [Hymenobacter sp.]
MKQFPLLQFVLAGLLGLLAACGTKKTEETAAATTTAPPAAASAPAPVPAATAPATAVAAPAATFDINAVPIATADLGSFPYFSKLPGYKIGHASDSVAFDFDRSYVYDGKALVPVEGRVLRCLYMVKDSKKTTSDLMIQRNYENLIKGLGGVQVSSGELSNEVVNKVGRDEYHKHSGGISPGEQADTYVIRQKDKEVWVQVAADGDRYQLNVTEKAAMPQQATTLPAAELKKN